MKPGTSKTELLIIVGHNLLILQVVTLFLVGLLCFLSMYQIKKYLLLELFSISFESGNVELNKTKTSFKCVYTKNPDVWFVDNVDWKTSPGLQFEVMQGNEVKIWLESDVIEKSTIPMKLVLNASIKEKTVGQLFVNFTPVRLPEMFNSLPMKVHLTPEKLKEKINIKLIPSDSNIYSIDWSWDQPLMVTIQDSCILVQVDLKIIPFGETELFIQGSYEGKVIGKIPVILEKPIDIKSISFYPEIVELKVDKLFADVRWESDPVEIPEHILSLIKFNIQPPIKSSIKFNESAQKKLLISISEDSFIQGETTSLMLQATLGTRILGQLSVKIVGPSDVPTQIDKEYSDQKRDSFEILTPVPTLKPTPVPTLKPTPVPTLKPTLSYSTPKKVIIPSTTPVRIVLSPTPEKLLTQTITPNPQKEKDSEEEERRKRLWQR